MVMQALPNGWQLPKVAGATPATPAGLGSVGAAFAATFAAFTAAFTAAFAAAFAFAAAAVTGSCGFTADTSVIPGAGIVGAFGQCISANDCECCGKNY